MDNPFFTVIIPTYNRADLIRRPVESVLAQTFQSWELIIVDDGSTDNTEQVVKSYTDPRIRYVYQQNQERSTARNTGVKNARSQYICFLDSDDYYLYNRLEKLFSYLKSQHFPSSLVYTNKLIDRNGHRTKASEDIIRCNNIYDQIITSVIHVQQVCAHYSVFQKYLFNPNFRISEDTELWLRVADDFKIEPINQFTVVIGEHAERTVSKNVTMEMLRTIQFVFDKKHSGTKISPAIQKELVSNILYNNSRHYLVNRKYLKGLWYLTKSVIVDIHNLQTKYKLNIILKVVLPIYRRDAVLALLESGPSSKN